MSKRPTYAELRAQVRKRYPPGQAPGGVTVDDIVQLKMQNTYNTHLDIAREMAGVMRADMAVYDKDHSKFTQSLGCWSGFHAQQMIKAVKRMKGTAKGTYVYLSGWMVAGLRNRFGHLPDQSMHEKTSVADLIEEIYVSLRQADEVALNDLFRELKSAREKGAPADVIETIIQRIDTFESHVVPIIADIDAGFGNEHATYLLAKELIKLAPAASRSRTRFRMRNSAATRMARSRCRAKTSSRSSAPAVWPSKNSASMMVSSWRVPTASALA